MWHTCGAILLALSVAATPAVAGTIRLDFGTPLTVATTPSDDAALVSLAAAANAARRCSGTCPDGLPPWTVEFYLADVFRTALAGWVAGATPERRACDAYKSLSEVEQRTIRLRLGGRSPC